MGLFDGPALRASHAVMIERLEADETFGLNRPQVEASLVRDASVRSTFTQYGRAWEFLGDETADRGGHETGPTPMRYFLSGIAFCALGWWAKGAALQGVELSSLSVTLRTFLDIRGEYGFDDAPVHPQLLAVEVSTSGGAADDAVRSVIDWGLAHCPLSVLVGRAIPLQVRITHDGRTIRDDPSPRGS